MSNNRHLRNPDVREFAQGVRARRIAAGLSQEQLAELAELDRTYVGHIEQARANPTLLVIARMARALGVSTSQILSPVHS